MSSMIYIMQAALNPWLPGVHPAGYKLIVVIHCCTNQSQCSSTFPWLISCKLYKSSEGQYSEVFTYPSRKTQLFLGDFFAKPSFLKVRHNGIS